MDRITFEGNFCDIAMCRESPCPYNGMCSQRETWERLKKYEGAEQHGRLVVLPCKVGDTVYTLRRTFDGADVVGEKELWWDDIPQLGKTVFLTHEEAENALEVTEDA